MERSFFYGTDAEVASGSSNFSTRITASPTDYGLVALQAAAYAAVDAAYQAAYTAAITPATRTSAAIETKNQAKVNLRAMASDLAKIIDGTASVTNTKRIELGLAIRATPAPIPVPGMRPGTDVVSVFNRTVRMHIHDSASSTRRGKPPGVAAAWVYSYVGATYPTDPAEWNFEGSTTRATFDIIFPNTVAAGAQVWICAAWINARQQAGPVSVPVTTNVQGGGMGLAA
jgi:hypothetical protein